MANKSLSMAPSIPGEETPANTRCSPQETQERVPLEVQRKTGRLGLVAWPVMPAPRRLRQEDGLQAGDPMERPVSKQKGLGWTGEWDKRLRSPKPTCHTARSRLALSQGQQNIRVG